MPRDHYAELDQRATRAMMLVRHELTRAMSKHAPMNSAHEGYAVILEEVDELWAEVKKRRELRDPAKMREEAVQVATMALRFLIDVLPGPESEGGV